ncbi:MAG: xanthine dehydrogenase family protein [Candidatus Tectomicrobia bacterium]|uniref:Xanthine dehydrogenase family protein n=1 Tax=Tectimicrobiota bacterium TaxID=2528274 RepID=A0A932HYC4_UNCTE|nr:xanthine dehydrogenase family protein [Candidatus Tectomicrobia bacterium]
MNDYKVAGKGLARIDTPDKAAGTACFGADVPAVRPLAGRVLGTPHAFARVLSVDASRARKIPGVRYVLTRDECPDIRFGGDIKDQSWLGKDGYVRYVGDPVAAVAAETPEAAQAAIDAIRVRYEPLAPVVDPIASREGRTLLVHEDWKELKGLGPQAEGNVLGRFEKTLGDPGAAFAQADVVLEHTFRTPHVHAGYIEPHACTAEAGADGKVTVWTTTQDAWAIRADVAEALGLPATKVRVIPTEIGGGFGSKLKSIYEHIAALLALRTGRAVRMEMSREEDHRAVNPRHPHVFTIKTGVKRDGTLVAREMDVTMDHGAYGRGAPFQCSSKMVMASALYRVSGVRVKACTVYSNAPVAGPVRAPSGPQYHFATEVHTDIVARELGMDPLEFRRKNALRPGDKTLAGVTRDDAMAKVMERAAAEVRWGQPVPRRPDLPEEEGWRYGRGIACGFWHGPGEASSCSLRLNPDGTVQMMSGTVNLTGASTSLCQLVAEELGLGLDHVRYAVGDTDTVPQSTAASGSKATRSVAGAAMKAVKDLRKKILEVAGAKLEAAPGDLLIEEGKVKVASARDRFLTLAQVAKAAPEVTGYLIGDGASPRPPACPIYTAQAAEVAVHPELGEVRVLRLVGVQDVGFAINPLSVEGQIEGAMVQGMGLALMEEQFRHPNGRLSGETLHEYLLPTSMDMPELKVILYDNPAEGTPFGMRGVGEPPIVATAAAIVNAIQDAVGVPFFSIPVGPHHLRKALAAVGNGA